MSNHVDHHLDEVIQHLKASMKQIDLILPTSKIANPHIPKYVTRVLLPFGTATVKDLDTLRKHMNAMLAQENTVVKDFTTKDQP